MTHRRTPAPPPRTLPRVAGAATLLLACVVPDGILEDRPCPCADGFRCVADRCVRGDDLDASVDAGGLDAGPPTDAPAVDAPRDGGPDAGADGGTPFSRRCWREPTGCDWSVPGARFVPRAATLSPVPPNLTNPRFSSDACTLYYASGSPTDLFEAERGSAGAAFGTGVALEGVNTEEREGVAAVTPDGLELFFTRHAVDAPTFLYRARRDAPDDAWSGIEVATDLQVDAVDHFDPALSPDGLHAFFTAATATHPIYRASRGSLGVDFDEPEIVDVDIVETPDSFAEPAVNADDTLLAFIAFYPPRRFELYFVTRDSPEAPYGRASLAPTTTARDTVEYALSPDGCELFVRVVDGGWSELVYELE